MEPDPIGDAELRALLAALTPESRDLLQRVLVLDETGRDNVAAAMLRYRDDKAGDDLGATIELLTMYPDQRQRVVRLLEEIVASNGGTHPSMPGKRRSGVHRVRAASS